LAVLVDCIGLKINTHQIYIKKKEKKHKLKNLKCQSKRAKQPPAEQLQQQHFCFVFDKNEK